MSWNEPGDRDEKNKKKDPWGRQGEGRPPNIDEVLRQLSHKIRTLLGLKEGGGGGFKPPTSSKTYGAALIGAIAVVVYGLSGIYVVEPAEEAVVLRFGRYVRTEGPGPHWIAPFIESREIVNVQEVQTSKHGGAMLTKDENIVSAEIAVQYRINNARDYLFNLVQPKKSLEQVSESALRAVVGQSTLNEVLTSGRSEIGLEIRKQVQQNLNKYKSGLEISDLAMQQTKAPEEVKAAFDDAIKAQQDEERLVNEAQAYSRKIVPIAEGQVKRTLQEAGAYKAQVTLEAQGKTAKFSKVLPEYRRAPQVTRERLYIDTLQQVYSNTPKVLIDVNSGNLIYLPLDKLLQKNTQPQLQPKEEEDARASEKSHQRMIPLVHHERPGYEEAERPNRNGE